MRTVYKTRSGVKIGFLYQPPLRSLNDDELFVQSALLKKGASIGLMGNRYIQATVFLAVILAAMLLARN